MNKKKEIRGDVAAFDKNWEVRKESTYTHFTTDLPKNQIQFAFRNHWEVISSFLESSSFNGGKRVLEVGCGRGSLSAYFANNGYDCTLLDKSGKVIDIAKESFYKLGLESEFIVGDVNNLPFEEETFDLITSIGLLEHFEDIKKPIEEQVRVLSKGGVFTAYVVPEYKNNIQKDYNWINKILRHYSKSFQKQEIAKESLYRSDDDSKKYIRIMEDLGLKNIFSSGIYSVPMISHSIDFPFSLMPDRAEEEIVLHFNNLLKKRKLKYPNQHPWLCKEGNGQAFIICGYKE
mgnify:CR=1 FL=1|tara:strand:+ start:4806 stop:5672 length:867 start_codon:yes stop_codon:yes gene_type:complete